MNMISLTESEKVTMKCVWDLGNGSRLAQIMALANENYKKNWKPQTVSTFLGKLVKKGYLEQYRDGRYFSYRILIDRHDYRCDMLCKDMEFWDDGDMEMYLDELLDKKTFPEDKRNMLIAKAKKA